ncbi:MAG TPA: hypothetical protein VGI90_00060 [Steroidobacteraceae bacterium]
MWSDSEARRGFAPVPPALGDGQRIPRTEQSSSAQVHLGDQLALPIAAALGAGESGSGPDLVARGIHALGRLFDVGT